MNRPSENLPAILIVRPPSQASADVAKFEAQGWRAVPFSPMQIEPDHKALQQLNRRFHSADAVFWVSPSAVETAAPHIDFSDGLPIQITVGQGSRKALAKFYPHNIICPEEGNDSEAVLALPVWNTLKPGAEILIVRGHGGRDFLRNALIQRGFQVKLAEVYFRRPCLPDWSVWETVEPQAAYITSAEMVDLLFRQVPDRFAQPLRTLLYFTHHPRIAEALRKAGARHVRMIGRTDECVTRSDE